MNMKLTPEIQKVRSTTYPINPVILSRWSPRAFSAEDLSEEEIISLFEAARYAPSSYNFQPWRFIYAKRGTNEFKNFVEFMMPMNQAWAKYASLLVVVASSTLSKDGSPSTTHSFDTGMACENLAIEAAGRGLITHFMAGFDRKKAEKGLLLPSEYVAEVMIAIGKQGKIQDLSKELQTREKPSTRLELSEIMMEGIFKVQ